MRVIRRQDGQIAAEYLGVLAVAVAVVAALIALAPGIGETITGRVLCIVQLQDCQGEDVPSAAPAPVDPGLTFAQRDAVLNGGADAEGVLDGLTEAERRWLELNDPQAAAAVAAAVDWTERRDLLDRWLAADLAAFLAYRESPELDPRLDPSTDGCSAPIVGNSGLSFDFANACLRHDFGYRNAKDLGLFEDRKATVDRRFLGDMKDHCATRSVFLQGACYRWAYTYYHAVKAFG